MNSFSRDKSQKTPVKDEVEFGGSEDRCPKSELTPFRSRFKKKIPPEGLVLGECTDITKEGEFVL